MGFAEDAFISLYIIIDIFCAALAVGCTLLKHFGQRRFETGNWLAFGISKNLS